MIGQEILRLPEIPEGTPEAQLRAIRSYLYRLTEQLQYLLAAEKEERLRGQAQCSREAFGSIQRQMLDSPQTAQLISAILGRQLGEKYVALGSLEGFLQREAPGYWDALHRLCRLEEKPEWEILDGARLCLLPHAGVGRQEGNRVIYTPLPRETGLLSQVYPGHWRME